MQQAKLFALFKANKIFKAFSRVAGVLSVQRATYLVALLGAMLLTGCSGMRIVDSQVSAFSKLAVAPAVGATWAFERLPSQQNLEGSADIRRSKLEAAATEQLGKLGFAVMPAASSSSSVQFTVQLSARTQRLALDPYAGIDPWGHPHYWGAWPGRNAVVVGSGHVFYAPLFPRYESPWYVREVSLLIRDANSKAIVYETQAKHEGRWADDEAVLPAMLAAALQGFPKPPEGKRMVNIEIPR
jgi:hypothetical protein